MNTKDTTAEIIVAPDVGVVKALRSATTSAVTAQKGARIAALAAFKTHMFEKSDERLSLLLSLYRAELANEVVRQAFSNALAVLCAGSDVRISATPATEGMGFKNGVVLAADEGVKSDARLYTFSPAEAVAGLSKADLTAAAKIAREKLGVARAEGGGRKAGSNNKKADSGKRAPFSDELRALLGDAAGRQIVGGILTDCGYTMALTKSVRAAVPVLDDEDEDEEDVADADVQGMIGRLEAHLSA